MAFDHDPLWYKDAVIYEVRVRSFYDHDGDGIGDFRGLTEKLDYLQELGVNALWLLPFYPSPLRDDGYDISDYVSVHSDVGTLADFKVFLRAAHERGLRVITELVLNHTSDRHAMFEKARRAPAGSPLRDYYVWSDTPDKLRDVRVIFSDFEHSNWAWDPVARAYYFHRFYSHQPDLNFDNRRVRAFIQQVMDFWLELGVDGLRLDAVPYLYKREGTNCENLPETHAFLRDLRRHIDARFTDRMLLAEANQWSEDAVAYFGQGDESHMAFHFPIMPRMFMAVQMEDRFPLIEIVSQTPAIHDTCQWALFLRNHDELTLEMVTDEERDYMYRAYADDPRARVNLGIRRRLGPLMRNNRRRIELMNALLFSLPGTPVVYYGDEIGMGDNIYLGDRNGVRTPMQWSPDRNAGFSRANPQRLFLPVVIDSEYHYEAINVATQEANPSSLLRWMQRLIGLRKRHPAFGRGTIEFLYPDNPRVLTFLRRHGEEVLLVVANLSRFAQYVELDLAAYAGLTPLELFGQTPFPRIGALPYVITLAPHGFLWFSLQPPADQSAHPRPVAALPVLRVRRQWDELLGRSRESLEKVLPHFLAECPGREPGAPPIQETEIEDVVSLANHTTDARLALVRVEAGHGAARRCLVPLAAVWGEAATALTLRAPQALIARLEATGAAAGAPTEGVLHHAMWANGFAAGLVEALAARRQSRGRAGRLVAIPLEALRQMEGLPPDALRLTSSHAEGACATAVYGDRLICKLYRRLGRGTHPDLEVSRTLAERTAFVHQLPLVGALEYRPSRGEAATVAVLRAATPGQGDAWSHALASVRRHLEQTQNRRAAVAAGLRPQGGLLAGGITDPLVAQQVLGDYLETALLLGRRTGELHVALATVPDAPQFAPEPFTALYRRALFQSMRNRVRQGLQRLRRRRRELTEATRAQAEVVLGCEEQILGIYRGFLDAKVAAQRTRCHGRLQLDTFVLTGTDALFADFEGDPARSLAERRNKRSPVRDVASLLRSLFYAAFAAVHGPEAEGVAGGGAATGAEPGAREAWALLWWQWAAASVVKTYLEVVAPSGILPDDPGQLAIQFHAYLLEEAIYAVDRELQNRPEWLDVALRLVPLVAQATDGGLGAPPATGR